MPSRQAARSQKLRQSIAAEAARIIATEGQRSYLTAKQKAAERLGASTRHGLPSNSEVEHELRAWQQLYGGKEREEHLAALREQACIAMRFLDEFRPRLIGPVAEGTADQFSRVSLQVFSDDPDAVARQLMDHRIDFDQERRRVRWHDGTPRELDVLVIDRGLALVELLLMIGRDSRQPLPSPIDGRPQQRLSLTELNELIDSKAVPAMPPLRR